MAPALTRKLNKMKEVTMNKDGKQRVLYRPEFTPALRSAFNDPLIGIVHYNTPLEKLRELNPHFRRIIKKHITVEGNSHERRHHKGRCLARQLSQLYHDFFQNCLFQERHLNMIGKIPHGLSHPIDFTKH